MAKSAQRIPEPTPVPLSSCGGGGVGISLAFLTYAMTETNDSTFVFELWSEDYTLGTGSLAENITTEFPTAEHF